MLESLLGLGLLAIYLESCAIAVTWDNSGKVQSPNVQRPVPIFADASNGSDSRLRDLSEQSFDEVIRMLDQASASLMSIRILDAKGRFDRRLREFIAKCEVAVEPTELRSCCVHAIAATHDNPRTRAIQIQTHFAVTVRMNHWRRKRPTI